MGNQKETQKNPQYKYASTREKLCSEHFIWNDLYDYGCTLLVIAS